MNELPDHYCHGPTVREVNDGVYYKAWKQCAYCGVEWLACQVNLNAVKKLTFNKEETMPDQTPEDDTNKEIDPMHPAVRDILKFFKYEHLPKNLQAVSKPICELAETMAMVGSGAELTVGLRKLLEAKDCFVRSVIK